jgi:hypothetical protein
MIENRELLPVPPEMSIKRALRGEEYPEEDPQQQGSAA